MISPLLFAACFMFALVLLALGVIYSHVHWLIKAGLISSSLCFAVLLYLAYVGSLGYAAPIQLPSVFRFLYAVVQEPTPERPGQIYIWMLDHQQPRAISIAYSTERRKLINIAKKRVQEGEIVYLGTSEEKQGGHEGKGGSSKSGRSIGSSTVPYQIEGEEALSFKQPPDTLPKKEP
jgi:hypothetical protein